MKYEGEKFELNQVIHWSMYDDFEPYIKKIEKITISQETNTIINMIKRGLIIKHIIQIYNQCNDTYNKNSCISFLCEQTNISSDGRIIRGDNSSNLFIFENLLSINYYFVKYLIDNKESLLEDIKRYIDESYLLNNNDFDDSENTKILLKYGIEKLIIDKDAISSTFILINQLEHLLRNVCKINDISPISKRKDKDDSNIENLATMNEIINRLDNSDVYIDSWYIELIKRCFLDSKGFNGLNYRNNICHGIPCSINKVWSSTILVSLLYIL